MRYLRWLLVALPLLLGAAPAGAQSGPDRFDHPKHAKLFPRCETCHVGAANDGAPMFPDGASCAACHDGSIKREVRWTPPVGRASNLRYVHGRHRDLTRAAASRGRGDAPTCTSCHQLNGAGWMQARRAVVGQCLSCHKTGPDHLAVADTACATCHVPLAQAESMTRERIKAFPAPAAHRIPGFMATGPAGHGAQSKSAGTRGVAASCATCHARDFCASCHVNAPETRAIQALDPDPRSLAIATRLVAPRNHAGPEFLRQHGSGAGSKGERCATCHTRESCTTCHVGQPGRAIQALAVAGPGRGPGAQVARRKPASHVADFGNQHSRLAVTEARSCATCHARTECLQCHRPDAAASGGYHPAAFLTRHPASAYARESSCSDCHNPQQFCATCHKQAGVITSAPLGGRGNYHDGKQSFLLGHGQAARQSLESCVSCHVERDCLKCHASVGGRRFNPHGPGFDAARLKRKNPQMCLACHGYNIP